MSDLFQVHWDRFRSYEGKEDFCLFNHFFIMPKMDYALCIWVKSESKVDMVLAFVESVV